MSKTAIPNDDVIAARMRRYGQHSPMHPLRSTRVPSVLAEHPTFRKLAAERQAVVEAELRLSAQHAELTARNELARAEHREAQRRAMLTGEDPPPRLELEPWPFPEHTRPMFDRLHRMIEATELGTLGESADRLTADLENRSAPMRKALRDARRTVAELEAELLVYDNARETLSRLSGEAAGQADDPAAAAIERRMAEPTPVERAADAQIVADFQQAMRRNGGSRR
jgi:hypothetical protein